MPLEASTMARNGRPAELSMSIVRSPLVLFRAAAATVPAIVTSRPSVASPRAAAPIPSGAGNEATPMVRKPSSDGRISSCP